MIHVPATTDRWFSPAPSRAGQRAPCLLFALPHAGSGASAYRAWGAAFPGVEVLSVQLPGRESRWSEDAVVDPADVAAAIRGAADRPYVIFGHSLGGRLGYEVVRELQAQDAPLPERLVVSGSAPPELPNEGPLRGVSLESDEVLLERVIRLGGIAPEVAQSAELLELFLPAMRGDFTWIDDYHWRPGPPLQVPITALAGSHDGVALPPVAAGWSRHSAPGFQLHTVPGGHFFLHEHLEQVAGIVRPLLTGSSRDPVAPATQVAPVPSTGRVDVWFTDLDRSGARVVAARALQDGDLSEPEAERATRFAFDRDRDRYLLRCVAVRRLARHYGQDLAGASWPVGPHGKPEPEGFHISWSHSQGLLLVAVSGSPVGADIERLTPLMDPDSVISVALAPDERVELDPIPTGDRNAWLLQTWTAKEALLKGTGVGLTVEPSTISFAGGKAQHRWEVTAGSPRGWHILPLHLPEAVASLSVISDPEDLRIAELTVLEEGSATRAGSPSGALTEERR